MKELEVVIMLIEENRLREVTREANKIILEMKKRALLEETIPLFYCFSLHDECENCAHPFIYCKIASTIIPDNSRKYPLIKYPECGHIEEYKRTSWWGNYTPDVLLKDFGKAIPWKAFQDLTQFFEG